MAKVLCGGDNVVEKEVLAYIHNDAWRKPTTTTSVSSIIAKMGNPLEREPRKHDLVGLVVRSSKPKDEGRHYGIVVLWTDVPAALAAYTRSIEVGTSTPRRCIGVPTSQVPVLAIAWMDGLVETVKETCVENMLMRGNVHGFSAKTMTFQDGSWGVACALHEQRLRKFDLFDNKRKGLLHKLVPGASSCGASSSSAAVASSPSKSPAKKKVKM
ncbi:hypothetical protein RI054_35g133810 [Pseudoscourfieldia marina]